MTGIATYHYFRIFNSWNDSFEVFYDTALERYVVNSSGAQLPAWLPECVIAGRSRLAAHASGGRARGHRWSDVFICLSGSREGAGALRQRDRGHALPRCERDSQSRRREA